MYRNPDRDTDRNKIIFEIDFSPLLIHLLINTLDKKNSILHITKKLKFGIHV